MLIASQRTMDPRRVIFGNRRANKCRQILANERLGIESVTRKWCRFRWHIRWFGWSGKYRSMGWWHSFRCRHFLLPTKLSCINHTFVHRRRSSTLPRPVSFSTTGSQSGTLSATCFVVLIANSFGEPTGALQSFSSLSEASILQYAEPEGKHNEIGVDSLPRIERELAGHGKAKRTIRRTECIFSFYR